MRVLCEPWIGLEDKKEEGDVKKEDKPRRGFRGRLHSARWTHGWRWWPAGCAKQLSRGRRGRPQMAKTRGSGATV